MKSLALIFSIFFLSPVFGDEISDFLKKVYNDPEYSRTKVNTDEIKLFRDYVNSTFQDAVSENKKIDPVSLYPEYFELAQDIHFSGFSTEELFLRWQKNYKALMTKQPPSGKDVNAFWLREYEKLFEGHFSLLKVSPKSCAKFGEISTITKCCNGLVSLRAVKPMNSCTQDFKACSTNSECCSNACEKTDPNKPGKCVVTNKCFELKEIGQSCGIDAPYCARGICRDIDKNTLGMKECKREKNSCSKNEECCSNSCNRGKCVENKICTDCVTSGVVPKRGQSCCAGYYVGPSGKCEIDMPPLVPFSTKVEKVFKTILNNLFPEAIAQDQAASEEAEPEMTEAQASLIEDRTRECAQTFNTSSEEYKDCMKSVETLQTSYLERTTGSLTQVQKEEIDKNRHACISDNESGSNALAECLEVVDKKEKDLKARNAELGIGADQVSSSDYFDKYEIPAVTAKTYSDIKKCEFNSFNDHWRDASDMEKNAELFLRAFEYVYSHEGTQDFWQEKDKGNIFKRANVAAKDFRENRLKMFQSMKEVDKKMGCKCIAIFGPRNFSSDKQSFFDSHCQEEKALLQSELGTDNENGSQIKSEIDGTSIDGTKTKNEQDTAELEEVDKGAIAISHEKLLVEWLGLRRDAMYARFDNNSDNEEDLDALSTFISTYEFEEVWKDKPGGTEPIRNTKASPYVSSMGSDFSGDSELLYSWYYIVKKGFLSIILIVIAIILIVITVGAALVVILAVAAVGAVAIFLTMGSSFGPGGQPGVYDLNYKKTSMGKKKEKHSYDRWYLGPRYDNYSPVSDTRCKIFARASSCLKSAYKTDFKSNLHFLVDTTRPLFVPNEMVTLNKMPNYPQDFRQMVNDARQVGVNYLRELGGATKSTDNLQKSKSYGSTASAHLEQAIKDNMFSPLKGELIYQVFDEQRQKAVKDGAKKYALCFDLKSCGAVGIEDEALGFANLFEDEKEAEAFATYAYDMHFVWSHLTQENYLGYPLLGQDAYFKLVAYNMKVLGSMSAKRAKNYGEAYELYKADWEKRKDEYKRLDGGGLGTGSRNIKYSERFYNAAKLLSFDGISDIETFDGAVSTSAAQKKEGEAGFNSAELASLGALRNLAVKVNDDIKKKQAYDSTQGEKKGNSERVKAVGDFLSKINNPTATIGLKKFGGLGDKGSYNGLLASTNGKNLLEKKSESSVKPFNFGSEGADSGYGRGSSYGNSSFADGGASKSDGQNSDDGRMSPEETNQLLESIEKSKELVEATEGDTLFQRVSKAYLRSYDRVLERVDHQGAKSKTAPKKESLSDRKKEELKSLLDNN